jgi:Flp pilus assembly pilin Flp
MNETLQQSMRSFLLEEAGQSTVEYGAILALVSLLVAVCFAWGQGTLSVALSSSFSGVVNQMNNLGSLAGSGT